MIFSFGVGVLSVLIMLPTVVFAQFVKYQVSIADVESTEGTFMPLTIPVNLTIGLDRPVVGEVTIRVIPSVQIAVGPNAATPIIDFMGSVSPLLVTFRTGDQFKQIAARIMADSHVESDEKFLVRIALTPASTAYAEIVDNSAEVRILDDDQADVSVWKSVIDLGENPV